MKNSTLPPHRIESLFFPDLVFENYANLIIRTHPEFKEIQVKNPGFPKTFGRVGNIPLASFMSHGDDAAFYPIKCFPLVTDQEARAEVEQSIQFLWDKGEELTLLDLQEKVHPMSHRIHIPEEIFHGLKKVLFREIEPVLISSVWDEDFEKYIVKEILEIGEHPVSDQILFVIFNFFYLSRKLCNQSKEKVKSISEFSEEFFVGK